MIVSTACTKRTCQPDHAQQQGEENLVRLSMNFKIEIHLQRWKRRQADYLNYVKHFMLNKSQNRIARISLSLAIGANTRI